MVLYQALELVLELAEDGHNAFSTSTEPHLEETQKEQEAAIERVGKFLQHRRECFYTVRGR